VIRKLLQLAILAVASALLATAQNPANEQCASCHDVGQKMAGTAHANVACSQCHTKHEEYPHPANVPKPECRSCHKDAGDDFAHGVHGMALAKGNEGAPECSTCHNSAHEVAPPHTVEFRKTVPDTCGMCHSEITAQFQKSVHGTAVAKGDLNAAVCSDCHGEHKILSKTAPDSPVFGNNIRETCAQCHGNVALARRYGIPSDRLTTFDASFHGLAARGRVQTVANCASCHGIHNILPSTDETSMIHQKNLPETCGSCHPGAGQRFSLGRIHVTEADGPPVMAWVRWFYLTAIPLTIGFMLIHNFGDWMRKLLRFHRAGPASRAMVPSGELRMYPFERMSHALLASSFIVLAWSGLALRYPDQWWAAPLMFGEEVRRNVHRVAAVVMMIVSLMHVASLIFNRKLREHWQEMIPRRRDIPDAMKGTAYNIGLTKEKPKLPHHGYIEKAEYWAVVWGTAVMVITGLMLWFNNWSLAWLPKEWLDIASAIHWYEAILASLAIVVWHFYSVIFDPDVYPMDTAWLTGRSPRRREAEEDHDEVGDSEEGEPAPTHGD
jgi:formate dehydrogenase gamma subunit